MDTEETPSKSRKSDKQPNKSTKSTKHDLENERLLQILKDTGLLVGDTTPADLLKQIQQDMNVPEKPEATVVLPC